MAYDPKSTTQKPYNQQQGNYDQDKSQNTGTGSGYNKSQQQKTPGSSNPTGK